MDSKLQNYITIAINVIKDSSLNRIDNLECLSRKEHGLRHHLPNRKRIVFPSGAVKVIRLAE